jgi:dTDP-4-dehydrorhamnose 3,5-epimerase
MGREVRRACTRRESVQMIFGKTPLAGAYVIEIEPLCDDRGLFARFYCNREFLSAGVSFHIAQSSISFNNRQGTLRGMHLQRNPKAEAKLVRCTSGSIFDVIIDLRDDSPTYCKWFGTELTSANRKMIYVPEGFAHGFQTLIDSSEVEYHISQSYSAQHVDGVRWNDPCFSINWPLEVTLISERDRNFPNYLK